MIPFVPSSAFKNYYFHPLIRIIHTLTFYKQALKKLESVFLENANSPFNTE